MTGGLAAFALGSFVLAVKTALSLRFHMPGITNRGGRITHLIHPWRALHAGKERPNLAAKHWGTLPFSAMSQETMSTH